MKFSQNFTLKHDALDFSTYFPGSKNTIKTTHYQYANRISQSWALAVLSRVFPGILHYDSPTGSVGTFAGVASISSRAGFSLFQGKRDLFFGITCLFHVR
ncbi:Uncharacterised protein [Serratia odorifera]|uniref:Uncharacterized protein n=1 Tax=Serratia odorifera TaxID=618 RepID=A0A3S4DQA3_SEROD|nr:Uncharacterised protein [Serratia odorifera]